MVKSFHADFPKHHSIPALDGVRGLSCLMVVFFHAGLAGWFPVVCTSGVLGIMLFFSLSGFLIALHYSPENNSTQYWKAFYIRRYVRLYPTFFCAILLGRLFYPHLFWAERKIYDDVLKEVDAIFLFISDSVFWTIPFEFKFYAVYPLLAIFITHKRTRAFSFKFLLAVWLLWMWVVFYGQWYDFYYYIYFLGGIIAAYMFKYPLLWIDRIPYIWTLIALFTGVCILGVFATHTSPTIKTWFDVSADSYFVSPLLALFILSIAKNKGFISSILACQPLRFLGKISYSIYLTHEFVLFPGRDLLPDELHHTWFVMLLVLVFALIFYFIIEKPFHTLAIRCARKIIRVNA